MASIVRYGIRGWLVSFALDLDEVTSRHHRSVALALFATILDSVSEMPLCQSKTASVKIVSVTAPNAQTLNQHCNACGKESGNFLFLGLAFRIREENPSDATNLKRAAQCPASWRWLPKKLQLPPCLRKKVFGSRYTFFSESYNILFF